MNKGIWATVLTVNQTNGTITVRFDNGEQTSKQYRYPKTGYIPLVNDRAYFVDNICLGIY